MTMRNVRICARLSLSFAALALTTMLSACGIEPVGFVAPADDIYYPSGLAVHPNGRVVYVVSANTDKRYNTGTLTAIDLDQLKTGDLADENRQTIIAESTQYIDAFGAAPVLDRDARRMFVPTRENNTHYVMDLDATGTIVGCGDRPVKSRTSCDSTHSFHVGGTTFDKALDDTDAAEIWNGATVQPLPGLPVEYLFLTHLGAGVVTAYDITRNALTNPMGFAAAALLGKDRLGGTVNGTAAIAVAGAASPKPYVYVGSSKLIAVKSGTSASGLLFFFEPKLATADVGDRGAVNMQFYLGGPTLSTDVKFLLTNPAGDRLFALTRDPDSLSVLDVSLDASGYPKNDFIKSVSLGRQPTSATYVPAVPGGHDLIYVATIGDGAIFIIDAETYAVVGKIRASQEGPFYLGTVNRPAGPLVVCTYFNDDGLIVIDASNPDPTLHTPVARIGSRRSKKVTQ
jgi:DNA-binding beta-propeller fold protein YncE